MALSGQDHRPIAPGLDETRVRRQGLVEGSTGRGQFPAIHGQHRAAIVGLGLLRILAEHFVEGGLRPLGQASGHGEAVSPVDADARRVGFRHHRERLAERRVGLGVSPHPLQGEAPAGDDRGVSRPVEGEGPVEIDQRRPILPELHPGEGAIRQGGHEPGVAFQGSRVVVDGVALHPHAVQDVPRLK